jgi:hypothetical protein
MIQGNARRLEGGYCATLIPMPAITQRNAKIAGVALQRGARALSCLATVTMAQLEDRIRRSHG